MHSYKCPLCHTCIRLPLTDKLLVLWCSFCKRVTPHTRQD